MIPGRNVPRPDLLPAGKSPMGRSEPAVPVKLPI
jgi:hypothetical protein